MVGVLVRWRREGCRKGAGMHSFAESKCVCWKAGFMTVELECEGHDWGGPRITAWLEKFAEEKWGRGYGDAERAALNNAYHAGRADAVLKRVQQARPLPEGVTA